VNALEPDGADPSPRPPTRRGLTRKRLFGVDRSGPEPPETRAGAPLRPFTIPNLIGYARLASLPVFCVLAFGSGDGRDLAASVIYGCVTWGDYFDGMIARATGQYSRLGALLDPVVDRLTVLSGVAVCWHFELLPRWALALLLAREIAMPMLARFGLRRGLDIEINWVGRIATFLVFSAIFWAMVFDSVLLTAVLLVGVAMAYYATALYIRTGFSTQVAGRKPSTSH